MSTPAALWGLPGTDAQELVRALLRRDAAALLLSLSFCVIGASAIVLQMLRRKSRSLALLSTTTGAWRQITDFGERATFIARRVSWSSDECSILAAVAEGDSDIVLLEGLTNVARA